MARTLAEKKDSSVKVFVYGTLLSGYGNWNWALKDQKLIGEAETLPEYTMLHLGGFPGIIEGGSTAIKGEVYEVDEERMEDLDRLEGADLRYPEAGMYRRETITLADGQEVLTYIYNAREGWDNYDEVVESGSWRQEEPPMKYHYA